MRKLLVAALMVLSFAGGTLFGQWTDIDFLGMVVEQANATLDTAHADGPGETAETTSDVSAPDPAPGASEPAVSEPVEEAATDTAPPPVDPVPDTEMPVPAASDFELAGTLGICPRMTVSNAPATDADLEIAGYEPFVQAEGAVLLAVAPTEGCVSSGMGPRNGRVHKGLDVRTDDPGMVYAAAPGTILEAHYRQDYGNQVVIDHGDGVFTRYAHLAGFAPDIAAGGEVQLGTPLGPMGNTASYSIPVHLHYEVLVGDYDTPAKSFGLTAKDPFDYPFVGTP